MKPKTHRISIKSDATRTPIDPANALRISFEMEIDVKSERDGRVLEAFGRLLKEVLTDAEAQELLEKFKRAAGGAA